VIDLLHCRRLPHPVADVPSVSGEQAPKPTSPRVPARGRGRIRFFWEAPSQLLAGRLLPTTSGVHRSPSTVFFFFFLRADNPTVRMSILCVLFGFISFLLLALDSVNLIQIIVLVSIHISVIHVVGLFLVVGINLCIAKLLLFPTLSRYMTIHIFLKVLGHSPDLNVNKNLKFIAFMWLTTF